MTLVKLRRWSVPALNISLKMNRKAILYENIIFLVLNLVFFAVLLFFIIHSAGGKAVVQEKYAKQIALLIDEAKPGTKIWLDMEDAQKIAEKNNFDKNNIVRIDDENKKVIVSLEKGGGYSYSFFNDVEVDVRPDEINLLIEIGENA